MGQKWDCVVFHAEFPLKMIAACVILIVPELRQETKRRMQ